MQNVEYSISCSNLRHQYGASPVLDGADLRIKRGELYGLLGRNGAGKSTAIRSMCGFMRPDEGAISVAGIDVIKDPIRARRHIGVVSEDVDVYEKLTAREFLEFAGQMHGLSHHAARTRAMDLLTLLELEAAANRSIASYSLGMKKKTAFAAAMIHAPEVLFLDEPFNGVDAASTRSLCSLLTSLTAQSGVTILFTSHVTEMIERICTRVGFLHEGRIHTELEIRSQFSQHIAPESSLDDLLFAVCGGNLNTVPTLAWYR